MLARDTQNHWRCRLQSGTADPLIAELSQLAATPADWLAELQAQGPVGLGTFVEGRCHRPIFVKYYPARSALQKLRRRLGLAPAGRAFARARQLHQAAVRVPEPLCCIPLGGAGDLLLTEALQGPNLGDAWPLLDSAGRQHQLRAAADLLANLHAAGFRHRDAKWENFVLASDQLWLVDLDGSGRLRRARRDRARDLARFTLSAEQFQVPAASYRLFLQQYQAAGGQGVDSLLPHIRSALQRLRQRHRERYGRISESLI